jgi:hypothetical protein
VSKLPCAIRGYAVVVLRYTTTEHRYHRVGVAALWNIRRAWTSTRQLSVS